MYKARKSGVRRAAEIVGMLVLLGGICFLGYSLGAPLMDYFTSGKAEQTSEITSFTVSAPSATETAAPPQTTPPSETTADVIDTQSIRAYNAPAGSLLNTASLSAVTAQAKNAGYNAVVLELKDRVGYLNYSSSIEAVKDSDLIKGGLTLSEITAVCENAGVTPIAKISTLKDCKIQSYIDGVTYRFADDSYSWLDAAPENGGKQWVNPFLQPSVDYIGDLAEEIAQGGFRALILENTVFPELKPYDKTILPANVLDEDGRYKALVGIVSECVSRTSSAGMKIIVSADASEILDGYNGLSGSAEILRGRTQLGGVSLMVVYDGDSFGDELKTGTDSSSPLSGDASQRFATVFSQLGRYTGTLEIIPCLGGGISARELEEIRGIYAEIGCLGEVIR